MNQLVQVMLPELILIVAACVLFLFGMSAKAAARRVVPVLALLSLVVALLAIVRGPATNQTLSDPWNTFRIFEFAQYIKLLTVAVGMLFALMAWPSNANATGGNAVDYGLDVGEFYALMLLSISGLLIIAGANDIVLLFLGIELAAIPTYIMVSISRPLAVAQEAGIKYFFLGALAAALMLFGFSYLYGTTGLTKLDALAQHFADTIARPGEDPVWTSWQMLAALMLFGGFAFKMAAVPLHFYAGDVYQGAATPVTAFLAFVPKASGIVALIKVLYVVSGGVWNVPVPIEKLLWVLALLTMTFGNVLALLQFNVKRVLAYSSVAHSGYMLVGLTALVSAGGNAFDVQSAALSGVLFYLAAYGIMNAGAFAVLMLLPSREPKIATSAETFEDLAGQGRHHPALGLAMAVSCFSLTGLPLTIGFFGKFYLIVPAWKADLTWLVILTMVNAAISAAYYLRIVAAMFLRPEPVTFGEPAATSQPAAGVFPQPVPVLLALTLSVAGTLLFGIVPPATQVLDNRVQQAIILDQRSPSQIRATDEEPRAALGQVP